MRRLFAFMTMLIFGYAPYAGAANAESSFSVSVTVVAPGALTGQLTNPPSDRVPAGSSSLKPSDGQSLFSKLQAIPSERFASTDSAGKRGGIFP